LIQANYLLIESERDNIETNIDWSRSEERRLELLRMGPQLTQDAIDALTALGEIPDVEINIDFGSNLSGVIAGMTADMLVAQNDMGRMAQDLAAAWVEGVNTGLIENSPEATDAAVVVAGLVNDAYLVESDATRWERYRALLGEGWTRDQINEYMRAPMQFIVDYMRDNPVFLNLVVQTGLPAFSGGGGGPYTTTTPGYVGHGGVDEEAAGGFPRPGHYTMTGEQGYEIITPSGEILSHMASRRLIEGAMLPMAHAAFGAGEQSGGTIYVKPPAPKGTSKKGATSAGGYITGGEAVIPTEVTEAIQASQQATAVQTMVLAATIPAAASAAAAEQGRAQAAETRRVGNDTIVELRLLRQEVARLNRTFPTVVRDAVERVL
jgi:roadblock/LC7 domain-containing protein